MWGQILGGAIGAIGSLIGGKSDQKAAASANRKNLAFQREQANNRIKWTVQDAKRAGVHPLAALGANVPVQTPVSVPETGFGSGIAAGAAHLGEAVSKGLPTELGNLQKELLRSQIAQSDSVTSVNVARSRSIIQDMAAKAVDMSSPTVGRAGRDFTSVQTPFGRMSPAKFSSDAQRWEDRYAEGVSIPVGLFNLAADTGNSLWKAYSTSDVKKRAEAKARYQRKHDRRLQNKDDY